MTPKHSLINQYWRGLQSISRKIALISVISLCLNGYVLAPAGFPLVRNERPAINTGGASAPPNLPDRRPRRASALRAMLSAGCARSLRCDSGPVPGQNSRSWFLGGRGNFSMLRAASRRWATRRVVHGWRVSPAVGLWAACRPQIHSRYLIAELIGGARISGVGA